MKNTRLPLMALFLSPLLMLNCVNRPTGGVSTSNILLYSSNTISEESDNTGTFNEIISVTLQGSEFADTFTEGEEFGTTNLPDGLTVTVVKETATTATITIAGNATTHNGCDSEQMSFYFLADAFSDGKLPISFEAEIDIEYIKPTLTYSVGTLDENTTNDGSFPDSIDVVASNDGSFSTLGVLTEGTHYESFDIPTGLTASVTVADPTHATISFSGTADSNSPVDEVEGAIKFTSDGLSEDFCDVIVKHSIQFKMYRSIVMFASEDTAGDFDGRTGADSLCAEAMPELPSDYTGLKAFLTVSGADDIEGLNLPSGTIIESGSGVQIKDNFENLLLDGTIDVSLDSADVLDAGTLFWSGSNANGTIVPDRCIDVSNWASADVGETGQVGSSDVATTDWLTNADVTETCDQTHPILCVAYVD
jgi:hypothetical protein